MIKYIADFSFPNFLEQVNMQTYCPNYDKMAQIILSSSPTPPHIQMCPQPPISYSTFSTFIPLFLQFYFSKGRGRRDFFGQMERDLK